MKALATQLAWGAAIVGVMYLLIHPDRGLLFRSPGVIASIVLIGLGLCRHSHRRLSPVPVRLRRK